MPSQFDYLNEIAEDLTASKFSVFDLTNSDLEKAMEFGEFYADASQTSLLVPQAAADDAMVPVQPRANREDLNLFSKAGSAPSNEPNIVVSVANGIRPEISLEDAVPHIAVNDGRFPRQAAISRTDPFRTPTRFCHPQMITATASWSKLPG